MYTHDKMIIACVAIGQYEEPPMNTLEIISEMAHAMWEMGNMTEAGLTKHIDKLLKGE